MQAASALGQSGGGGRLMGAAQRLEEVLGGIGDLRTTDLAARLTVAGGVVEGIEAPVADVAQLETFTGQMEAYVGRVANIQNLFAENQAERNEAVGEYNESLSETAERLESGAEQLTVQSEKAKELREAMDEMASGEFNKLARGGGEGGGGGAFEKWAVGADGAAGSAEVAEKATRRSKRSSVDMAGALEVASTSSEVLSSNMLKLGTVVSGVVLTAVGGVVERFLDLDNQVQQFVDDTGIAADRAASMRMELANMTPRLRRAGLEISDMVEAQTTLTEEFGSFENAAQQIGSTFGGIQDPTKALRTEITEVAGRLRMSGQEAAEMISSFQELAATTGMSRQNLQRSAMAAAQTAEVAPKAVMQDIAENSEQLASFSGMSGERLAAAAAQARNLGTNIGSVAETTEQIVTDIPGFVQGIERATALSPQLGVDAQQLTRAAAQGPARLQEELQQQMQGVNFENLGVFARQRLEDAIPGQTIADLQRMAEGARRAEMSTSELAEKVSQGKAPMTELFDAADSQTALTELENQFSALIGTISVALVPTFNRMESMLTSALEGVTGFVKWARQGAKTFQEWSDSLGPVGQSVRAVVEALAGVGGVAAAWQTLSSVMGSVGFSMTSATGATSALVSALGLASTPISLVVGGVAALTAAVVAFREPLWDIVRGLGTGLMEAVRPLKGEMSELFSALAPLGNRLGQLFDAMMTGTGSAQEFYTWSKLIGNVVGDVVLTPLRMGITTVEVLAETLSFFGNVAQGVYGLFSDNVSAANQFGQALGNVENILFDLVDFWLGTAADFAAYFVEGMSAQDIEDAVISTFSSILDYVSSLPGRFISALSGTGSAIKDALTPDVPSVQSGMQQATSAIASYIPFSPAEQGPLADIGKADIGGEIARSIQPEPVKQEMEATMGQATQAATEGAQGTEIEQANQVQVDAGTGGTSTSGGEVPEGAIPLLRKISDNEEKILRALQNLDVDAYLDSTKVTDALRKENNKNAMKSV